MTDNKTISSGFGLVGLIIAIAGYYWGKEQGYYWLWKVCQIFLYMYGISIIIVVLILFVLMIYVTGLGIKSLMGW